MREEGSSEGRGGWGYLQFCSVMRDAPGYMDEACSAAAHGAPLTLTLWGAVASGASFTVSCWSFCQIQHQVCVKINVVA